MCPHLHLSVPPPLQRRGLCPQHPAWTTGPAASLHGPQRYRQQPFVGANWCRCPTPPPRPYHNQQPAGKGYSGAVRHAEHGLAEQPACSRQGWILQHGTDGEVVGRVLETTVFGGAGRTKASTYPQPAPAEQWSRGWEKEAPRGALPSPHCSVGTGRAADPHKC